MKKLILIMLFASGCASAPRLKDFNKIEMGMSKAQVVDALGEPKTTRAVDGREILEYDAEDGDETKPRIVVLEDREVVFYGRPSEYKRQSEAQAQSGPAITTTVSPTISPTFTNAPVITISAPQSLPVATETRQTASDKRSFFYPAPTLEDLEKQQGGQ